MIDPLRHLSSRPPSSDSFEVWVFRSSRFLHHAVAAVAALMCVVGVVIDLAVPKDRTDLYEDAADAITLILLIAGRELAHQATDREKAQRWVTGIATLTLLLAPCTLFGRSDDSDSGLSDALLYIQFTGLLAVTFPLAGWAVVLSVMTAGGTVLLDIYQDGGDMLRPLVVLLFSAALAVTAFFFTNELFRRAYEGAKAQSLLDQQTNQYIAALSHDFGTPIAALQMTIDGIVARGSLPASEEAAIKCARASLGIMSTIRDKALALGQRQAGKVLRPAPTCIDLREVLSNVEAMTESIGKGRDISVDFDTAEDVPETVLIDGGWVAMILVNFLSNALKYTREVGGSVSVCIKVVQGGNLRFVVSDTGPGVRSKLVSSLFQKYARGSKWEPGTGLGLYHVHELATAMGGSASYAPNTLSRTGTGSMFWVDAPLVQVEVEDSMPPGASAASRKQGVPASVLQSMAAKASKAAETDGSCDEDEAPGKGEPHLGVLFVDDDPNIRLLMKALLEHIDVAATEAEDGREALQLLKSRRFDLVLTDVRMPVMDGFECVRQFREWEAVQHPAGAHTFIVGITANAEDPECKENASAVGMDLLLPKPISAVALQRLVDEHVGRRRRLPLRAPPRLPLPEPGFLLLASQRSRGSTFASSSSSTQLVAGSPQADGGKSQIIPGSNPSSSLLEQPATMLYEGLPPARDLYNLPVLKLGHLAGLPHASPLLTRYYRDAEASLKNLERAIGDAKRTASVAHHLAGEALYAGSARLAAMLKHIERNPNQLTLEAITRLGALLDEARDAARAEGLVAEEMGGPPVAE